MLARQAIFSLKVMRICIGFDLYRAVIGTQTVSVSQPIRTKVTHAVVL